MKIQFQKEIKRIPNCDTYDEVVQKCTQGFEQYQTHSHKFYYVDRDGDVVTVTNQDDFTEALEEVGEGARLKLVIAAGTDQAKACIEQSRKETAKVTGADSQVSERTSGNSPFTRAGALVHAQIKQKHLLKSGLSVATLNATQENYRAPPIINNYFVESKQQESSFSSNFSLVESELPPHDSLSDQTDQTEGLSQQSSETSFEVLSKRTQSTCKLSKNHEVRSSDTEEMQFIDEAFRHAKKDTFIQPKNDSCFQPNGLLEQNLKFEEKKRQIWNANLEFFGQDADDSLEWPQRLNMSTSSDECLTPEGIQFEIIGDELQPQTSKQCDLIEIKDQESQILELNSRPSAVAKEIERLDSETADLWKNLAILEHEKEALQEQRSALIMRISRLEKDKDTQLEACTDAQVKMMHSARALRHVNESLTKVDQEAVVMIKDQNSAHAVLDLYNSIQILLGRPEIQISNFADQTDNQALAKLRSQICKRNLVPEMLALDKDTMTDDVLTKMDVFKLKENWNQKIYSKMSETTGLFFQWVTAIHSYAKAKQPIQKDKDEMQLRTRRILGLQKELREIQNQMEQIRIQTLQKTKIVEHNKEQRQQLTREQAQAHEDIKRAQEIGSASKNLRQASPKNGSLRRFESLERNSIALVRMIEDLPDENSSTKAMTEQQLPQTQSLGAQSLESLMSMDVRNMLADEVRRLCKIECQKFMNQYVQPTVCARCDEAVRHKDGNEEKCVVRQDHVHCECCNEQPVTKDRSVQTEIGQNSQNGLPAEPKLDDAKEPFIPWPSLGKQDPIQEQAKPKRSQFWSSTLGCSCISTPSLLSSYSPGEKLVLKYTFKNTSQFTIWPPHTVSLKNFSGPPDLLSSCTSNKGLVAFGDTCDLMLHLSVPSSNTALSFKMCYAGSLFGESIEVKLNICDSLMELQSLLGAGAYDPEQEMERVREAGQTEIEEEKEAVDVVRRADELMEEGNLLAQKIFQGLGLVDEHDGQGQLGLLDLPAILEAKADEILQNHEVLKLDINLMMPGLLEDDFDSFIDPRDQDFVDDPEAELYSLKQATESYADLQLQNQMALNDCEEQLGIMPCSQEPESDSEQEFFDTQLESARIKKRQAEQQKLQIQQELESSPEYQKQKKEAAFRRTRTQIIPSQEAFLPKETEEIAQKRRDQQLAREKDFKIFEFYQMM